MGRNPEGRMMTRSTWLLLGFSIPFVLALLFA